MQIATLSLEPGKFYRRQGWAKETKKNHFGKTETVQYLHAIALMGNKLVYVSISWTYYIIYKVGQPYVTSLRTEHYRPYSIAYNSLVADDWEQIELTDEFALKGGLKLPEFSTEVTHETRVHPMHFMDEPVIR